MSLNKVLARLKAPFLMVVVQVAYAGVSILYKLVANDGMNLSILMAYRFLFASAFIVPLAFLVERASIQQNLFVEAVALANATYATAMYNLIPGVTFILAFCFGLEKLNIRKITGKAKVVGTMMGICGAMILAFYKSIEIHLWSTHINLMPHIQPHDVSDTQIWGSALAFGTCLSYSIWLIIQARMSEKFPWHYTSAALMSVMASIQSVIFALCMERDLNQWKLGWNIRLLTALYSVSLLLYQ
ncbi:hypothetical protein TanjilG_30110 [Lupinus angustifolius]|uniref:WAT1-related protein n=1 Tax=Lupinus angustifolius TaxID=3871 RepID=A0A4P1R7K6_LUPAN|nr:hypothetical protein TanjilG_30110 [Lupinus angustifolius]